MQLNLIRCLDNIEEVVLHTIHIMDTAISITGQTGCPHRQPYSLYLTDVAKWDRMGLERVPTAIDGHCHSQ